jgi:hypothetical protein
MADKSTTKKNGAPRKAAAPAISSVDFVKAWEGAASLADAKKALGPGASSRATRLRNAGVPLKEFAGAGRKTDVAALAALIGKAPLPAKPKKAKEMKETTPAQ